VFAVESHRRFADWHRAMHLSHAPIFVIAPQETVAGATGVGSTMRMFSGGQSRSLQEIPGNIGRVSSEAPAALEEE
jgi:hypothetical protein